ncbi:MAG TPA: sigma-E factor negative regulatory protein [Methylophilaceae bacterium]|nr:sigma-E factor negative regulatory protein [Methylophilaceae bacterium]
MKDQISALVDNELSIEGSEHLFKVIKSGSELGQCWATYHLIGDAMRGSPMFKPGFNDRLMQMLENEPTVLVPQAQKSIKKSFIRTSPMWSIAASFAAVMFVGWMVLHQQVQTGAAPATVEIAQNNVPSEYLVAHQSYAPSPSAYYIQPAAYTESSK